MKLSLSLSSIIVPRDSDQVVIGFHMGMPGSYGEIELTWQQAGQLAADIHGAAERARKNSLGGQHTTLILDTIKIDTRGPRHFGLDAGTAGYRNEGSMTGQ